MNTLDGTGEEGRKDTSSSNGYKNSTHAGNVWRGTLHSVKKTRSRSCSNDARGGQESRETVTAWKAAWTPKIEMVAQIIMYRLHRLAMQDVATSMGTR